MSVAGDCLPVPRRQRSVTAALRSIALSPRLYVYVFSAVLAVVISYILGKDMGWDTLEYHLYAGFSALHDRFGQDYFPAGSQSYFNPYVYVPFYLLATSGLPALAVATIFAVVQSGILWLTYELALEAAPSDAPRARIGMAVCATIFAAANPILINQFGSSYADVVTAEAVLGGWLLLVHALRAPRASLVLGAGLLLGAASALKPTNAVHAVSAVALLLFLPTTWRTRVQYALGFGCVLAASVALVCAPWSLQLQKHFGNPLFPLLNSIFRSPHFPTAAMVDYRFLPNSLAAALWRPFAIVDPVYMVDDEFPAPDLRYALLLVLGMVVVSQWAWRRVRRTRAQGASAERLPSLRILSALACGFLLDWVLWLIASGNGRYFLPMACVAAVLCVALVYRLIAARPDVCKLVLALVIGAQVFQLYAGSGYRIHVPWDGGPWFEVDAPKKLVTEPQLYLSFGEQSSAFLVPFLAKDSGFINLGGDYALGPTGANGARIESLIRRYSPHVRLLTRIMWPINKPFPDMAGLSEANDNLNLFGLRADTKDCSTIVVSDEGPAPRLFDVIGSKADSQAARRGLPGLAASRPMPNAGYLVSCPVLPDPTARATLSASQRTAELALDRIESACPQVFQPRHPATLYFGDLPHGGIWVRRYTNTDLVAWVYRGWVGFMDPLRGGPAAYIGRESEWDAGPLQVACGRVGERYYVKLQHHKG